MPDQHVFYYLDRKIILNSEKIYILGREQDCTIRLDEKTVSRQHAKLFYESNRWKLKDLGSTNGTLINYSSCSEQILNSGDKISIGPFICIYQNEDKTNNEKDSIISDTLLLEKKLQSILESIAEEDTRDKLYDLKHFLNSIRKKMDILANKDRLTGLNNRSYFDQQLQLEMERSKRYKQSCFLLMMDIDHFKKFNDTYGHQKGDEVLQAVARIIQNHMRKNDISCRFGGEEMAVILPQTTDKQAIIAADKIREMIKDKSRIISGLEVTVSIGLASAEDSSHNPEDIIRNSDKALYQAKERGRNRAVIYLPHK